MEGTPRGPDLELQQLLPEHRTVSVGDLLGALDPAEHAGRDRPHTLVNFVATVDGRTSFLGRSGPIGDEGDRQMFHGLRERVDAVMAGTATMRTERYGRIVRDPERRRRRTERGLAPEPLAVIVTRSGDVPFEIPLFAEPDARVVIFSPTDARHLELLRAGRGHPARSGAVDDDHRMATTDIRLRRTHAALRGRPHRVRRAPARGPRRRAVPDALPETRRRRLGGRRSPTDRPCPSFCSSRSNGRSSARARCS